MEERGVTPGEKRSKILEDILKVLWVLACGFAFGIICSWISQSVFRLGRQNASSVVIHHPTKFYIYRSVQNIDSLNVASGIDSIRMSR